MTLIDIHEMMVDKGFVRKSADLFNADGNLIEDEMNYDDDDNRDDNDDDDDYDDEYDDDDYDNKYNDDDEDEYDDDDDQFSEMEQEGNGDEL